MADLTLPHVQKTGERGLQSSRCRDSGKTLLLPETGGRHIGVVRVRRRGCPSRQGACFAGGACTWAITFSSSTLFAAFSSSTYAQYQLRAADLTQVQQRTITVLMIVDAGLAECLVQLPMRK